MKKIVVMTMALAIGFSLCACGSNTEGKEAGETTITVTDSEEEVDSESIEASETPTISDNNEETQVSDENEPAIIEEEEFTMDNVAMFDITSESLQDEWNEVISNTELGENKSPQFSFEPTEGAACYSIYMIDESASNWVHMKMNNVTESSFAEGAIASNEGDIFADGYVGPYPPSGTHNYVLYVFALKEAKEEYPGYLDAGGKPIEELAKVIDETDGGENGNILAYGKLEGAYTKK